MAHEKEAESVKNTKNNAAVDPLADPILKVRKIGTVNGGYQIFGITLPKHVLRRAKIKPGDHVELRVPEDGYIVLAKIKKGE